jgi:hypothetical protein
MVGPVDDVVLSEFLGATTRTSTMPGWILHATLGTQS